jgi:ribosomal protein L37AE/L43A
VSTAESGHPAWGPTDPTEADTCPGCGATHGVQRITGTFPTVDAWMCAACGMNWAATVVDPVLRVALSVVGLLPTPQQRTAALLAVLRTEVTQRSGKEPTMTVTLCLPATEVISIDAMASVDTVVWWCRLCDQHATTTTRPTAHSEGIEHLTAEHHATIGTAPE